MGYPKAVQIGRSMIKLSIETNAEAKANQEGE